MQTLAIVVVTVPLAAAIGLAFGIWATRSVRAERVLNAIFDVMQATPHMAYLGPVVVLFGFGQVPAMLATIGFALPPMARCTILGIRTVPSDIIEAGRMAGCTPRQLLWKVELPAAEKTLMLGLNQVVMQTLAMAVIASLVGASGLGQKLLFSLQQLQIGKAVEQGVAITLIAIVLDRLTQSLHAHASPSMAATLHPGWHGIGILALFLALLCVFVLASLVFPALADPAEGNDLLLRRPHQRCGPLGVEELVCLHQAGTRRDHHLAAAANARLLSLAALAGCHRRARRDRLSLRRPAARTSCRSACSGFLLLTGFWTPLMLTIYLVTSATILCVIIGVPLGIWASRSPRAARVISDDLRHAADLPELHLSHSR